MGAGVGRREKLLPGKTVTVDATALETDAAMKSIVRRDTGENWNEYLRRLMKEREGVETPTDEELRRFDKRRKDKLASNEEWVPKTDLDSRITKMKDGTTHLAYKAEHVVDLGTELIVATSICHADEGDADTIELAESVNVRTYISERKIEGKRNWQDVPEEKRRVALNSRRRVREARGASDCSGCEANWQNGALPICATPKVFDGADCMGSRRFKSVT